MDYMPFFEVFFLAVFFLAAFFFVAFFLVAFFFGAAFFAAFFLVAFFAAFFLATVIPPYEEPTVTALPLAYRAQCSAKRVTQTEPVPVNHDRRASIRVMTESMTA